MDAVELLPALRVLGQVRSRQVERAGRERLVDGDVDAAGPRTVHPDVRDQVGPSWDTINDGLMRGWGTSETLTSRAQL
jgi:hypothetical protein